MLAEILPRAETAMPFSLAQPRMALLSLFWVRMDGLALEALCGARPPVPPATGLAGLTLRLQLMPQRYQPATNQTPTWTLEQRWWSSSAPI